MRSHSVTRRRKSTTRATGDELDIPLHSAPIAPLRTDVLLSQMQPWAQERYLAARATFVCEQPASLTTRHSPFPVAAARRMLSDGNAEVVAPDHGPTRACCHSFSVVEHKPEGARRRAISWTEWLNDKAYARGFRSCAPLFHSSHYVSAALFPAATQFDLKLGFYQVELTSDERPFFRFQDVDGSWYQLTRMPMGHSASVDVMQLLTMTLAGCHEVVLPEFRCPHRSPYVWVDGAMFAGTNREVLDAMSFFQRQASSVGATLKAAPSVLTKHDFVGIEFDHVAHTVRMAEKTRNQLPSHVTEKMTAMELEQLAGRLLFGAGIVGEPLAPFYMALKRVRRVVNALNRETASPSDVVSLSTGCAAKLDELRKRVVCPRTVTAAAVKASATLFSDASLQGWGAVLCDERGRILITGGSWSAKEKDCHISELEMLAVRNAVLAFYDALAPIGKVHICVDNTSVEGVLLSGNSRSGDLAAAVAATVPHLASLNAALTVAYIRSADNPADIPSRQGELSAKHRADVAACASRHLPDGDALSPRWHLPSTGERGRQDWAMWEGRKLKACTAFRPLPLRTSSVQQVMHVPRP